MIKSLGLAMSTNKPLTKSSFIFNHWKYFSSIRVGPGELSSTKPRPVCRQDKQHQAGVGRRPQAGTRWSVSQGARPGSVTTSAGTQNDQGRTKMKDRDHGHNPASRSTGSSGKKMHECQDWGAAQTKPSFWESSRVCVEGSQPTFQTRSSPQCLTRAIKKYQMLRERNC